MNNEVLKAMVSSITKEEVEKRLPEIRKKCLQQLEAYIKSKAFNALLKRETESCLETWMENDFSDMLDSTSINRVIRKAINKIVGG